MSDDFPRLDAVDITNEDALPAGGFSAWLRVTRDSLVEHAGVSVPCGDCTACCRSSYFIHIGPDETETLARIPRELLFPAPGRPTGTMLMGYDQNGCCPMLVDDKCSIYAARPRTCRAYDCRVFAAAGVKAGGPEKRMVTERARRWRFDYPDAVDHDLHAAVRAATAYLTQHAETFEKEAPRNPTQLAILAIEVHDRFLERANEPDLIEVMGAVKNANKALSASPGPDG